MFWKKNVSKWLLRQFKQRARKKNYQLENVPKQFPSNELYNYFVNTLPRVFVCRRCSTKCYSNNKFHKHVKACKTPARSDTVTPKKVNVFHASAIQSDAPPNDNPGLNFRSWRYTAFAVSIKNENLNEICANTGCGVSLVDKKKIKKFSELPNTYPNKTRRNESAWFK